MRWWNCSQEKEKEARVESGEAEAEKDKEEAPASKNPSAETPASETPEETPSAEPTNQDKETTPAEEGKEGDGDDSLPRIESVSGGVEEKEEDADSEEKGRYIYNVCNIMELFYPIPPFPHFLMIFTQPPLLHLHFGDPPPSVNVM